MKFRGRSVWQVLGLYLAGGWVLLHLDWLDNYLGPVER